MPELPEVETMRRGVLRITGRRILAVEWGAKDYRPIATVPPPSRMARRLRGRLIQAVERVGKRLVLRLDEAACLVFEPRMTGLLLVADPPDREHLRMTLQLDGRNIPPLLFWDRRGLGTVQLLDPRQFAKRLGPDRLGPDALVIDADQLRERMHGSRREIKVALMDQRRLAGIGNLYASEILHVAGIHPQKRCDRMSSSQWQALHEAILDVLYEAIRYEGSTLGDGTYRTALNQAGSYQNQHRVYNRAAGPCPTCRSTSIVRIVQAQRSTFFCPHCQTRRPR